MLTLNVCALSLRHECTTFTLTFTTLPGMWQPQDRVLWVFGSSEGGGPLRPWQVQGRAEQASRVELDSHTHILLPRVCWGGGCTLNL